MTQTQISGERPNYLCPQYVVEVVGTVLVVSSLFMEWVGADLFLSLRASGTYIDVAQEVLSSWEWRWECFVAIGFGLVAADLAWDRAWTSWKPLSSASSEDSVGPPIVGLLLAGFVYWKLQSAAPLNLTEYLGTGFKVFVVGCIISAMGGAWRLQAALVARGSKSVPADVV
ncbi:MAG: hypothetical protein ABIK09_08430 [Pseudomonadota bacterium]